MEQICQLIYLILFYCQESRTIKIEIIYHHQLGKSGPSVGDGTLGVVEVIEDCRADVGLADPVGASVVRAMVCIVVGLFVGVVPVAACVVLDVFPPRLMHAKLIFLVLELEAVVE